MREIGYALATKTEKCTETVKLRLRVMKTEENLLEIHQNEELSRSYNAIIWKIVLLKLQQKWLT